MMTQTRYTDFRQDLSQYHPEKNSAALFKESKELYEKSQYGRSIFLYKIAVIRRFQEMSDKEISEYLISVRAESLVKIEEINPSLTPADKIYCYKQAIVLRSNGISANQRTQKDNEYISEWKKAISKLIPLQKSYLLTQANLTTLSEQQTRVKWVAKVNDKKTDHKAESAGIRHRVQPSQTKSIKRKFEIGTPALPNFLSCINREENEVTTSASVIAALGKTFLPNKQLSDSVASALGQTSLSNKQLSDSVASALGQTSLPVKQPTEHDEITTIFLNKLKENDNRVKKGAALRQHSFLTVTNTVHLDEQSRMSLDLTRRITINN